jgi:YidC/Oxa1 family membrane protein insertase
MSAIWNAFVDFFALILQTLTDWTGSLGIAIILFTILTRLLILPLTIKQLQSSRKMQALQPAMAELRRKYGKDQQRLTEEMSKLYREHKVNPAGSCLPLLIQLPIFLGVWQAVYRLTTASGVSGETFLGIDLGLAAWQNGQLTGWQYLILPILSVLLQLLTSVMAMPKIQDPQQKAMSQAMLVMPLVFGYIGFTFNQGAVLYWVTGSLFAVVQQYFIGGWGSLTNYLPFLPERQGVFAPVPPVAVPAVAEAAGVSSQAGRPEAEASRTDFWAPLNKLRTEPAQGSDPATEAAIREVKTQVNRKRR